MKTKTNTLVKWTSLGLSAMVLVACDGTSQVQALTNVAEKQMIYNGEAVEAEKVAAAEAAEADAAKKAAKAAAKPEGPKVDKAVLKKAIADGKKSYATTCSACHQPTGAGIPAAQFPPLAKSDWVNGLANAELIKIVLRGMTGEITVNGDKFKGDMAPLAALDDQQIADVLTYVKNEFNNDGGYVSPAEVKALRSEVDKPKLTQKDIKGADKLGK